MVASQMLTSTQRDLYFTLHNFKAARWLVDSLHWLADFSSLYSHYSLVGCFVGSPTSRILAHRLALPRFGSSAWLSLLVSSFLPLSRADCAFLACPLSPTLSLFLDTFSNQSVRLIFVRKFSMMATDGSPQAFAIVGDSNVRPHINKNSCRGNVQLKNAQVLSCGYLGIFAETLSKVKGDSTVCIISCLTNFLSKSNPDGPSTVSHRVDPVLQEIRDILVDACSRHPGRWYMVSPPMYRTNPTWFRDGLPEVLTLFSQVFSIERPGNLRLLPSFPTPSYEEDGVHLTAYSGLEFVLHLFDVSQEMLQKLDAAQEEVTSRSAESTRAVEDRVMVLEQDHRRLNRVVEGKTAADTELADFHINERWEDSFASTAWPRSPRRSSASPGKRGQFVTSRKCCSFSLVVTPR